MKINVNNAPIHVATGGKSIDPALPAVVFLHGSGLDHRTWALQSRWFAFRGHTVVAPDLPGHSLSGGRPLRSIEKQADWLWDLLDTLGIATASLVGHSQGALIALEAASREPQRVRSLSVVASAHAVPVNPALLEMAKTDQTAAVDAMLSWGFSDAYLGGMSHVPGQAPIAIGHRIMSANPLHADLTCSNAYRNGLTAAATVTAPTQLILARDDKMTVLKGGMVLRDALPNVQDVTVLDGVGHMLPIEAPDAVLRHLSAFITALD
ncbi:MAG: alpha/beta hydrolase [Pseudomonadota bacterium]